MAKIGRNDPCHCGSGKKYKNCHMRAEKKSAGNNKSLIYMGIFILIILLGSAAYYFNQKPEVRTCPPGQEWSEAHQHCHAIGSTG